MRGRDQILESLERAYREAFARAEEVGDEERMARLDFDFQRDQLWLEVLLDLRGLLAAPAGEGEDEGKGLLDHARALRDLTRR